MSVIIVVGLDDISRTPMFPTPRFNARIAVLSTGPPEPIALDAEKASTIRLETSSNRRRAEKAGKYLNHGPVRT